MQHSIDSDSIYQGIRDYFLDINSDIKITPNVCLMPDKSAIQPLAFIVLWDIFYGFVNVTDCDAVQKFVETKCALDLGGSYMYRVAEVCLWLNP
jgi:hypothetical protein